MHFKYVIMIAMACFIVGYMVHRPKDVVKTVTETRVEYKDRIVNKDRVIDRVVTVKTDGTVVTTEHETIKDRVVEKEVVKEKEVIKQVPLDKQWLVSIEYVHLNKEPDLQKLFIGKQIFCNLYVGIGVYTRMDLFAEDYLPKYHWQQISVGIAYLF